MPTLKILAWENSEPLKNNAGWPLKGFEIRIKKCTKLKGKDLKRLLRKISKKELIEIQITDDEKILSLIDLFQYHGAEIDFSKKV